MAGSSVISSFQLQSYKVDKLILESTPSLKVLSSTEPFPSSDWKVRFRFREPMFFKKDNAYVGGLDIEVMVDSDNPEHDKPQVRIEAGIAGLFRVSDEGRFPAEVERNLVLLQIPAILFPYLRGAITTTLASAGFGGVVLPLINLHAAAKEEVFQIRECD